MTIRELTLLKDDIKGSAIAAYIEKLHELKCQVNSDDILVYRGEGKDHKTCACRPNIFRNFDLNQDRNVEINILNTMSARKYTADKSYFEAAIEAQHGGFPSRLLDVTYNALVALFFAVTPHYTQNIASGDHENGVVYLFNIPKMYSPASSSIQENYENLLADTSPLRTEHIFSNAYKLLDHTSQNARIIAQDGAFILFYGNEAFSLPERLRMKLTICNSVKRQIREELEVMFNIHMGTMYPEMTNNVENITKKIKNLSAMPFSYLNEVKLLLNEIQMECEYRFNIFRNQENELDAVKMFDEIFSPITLFKHQYEALLENENFNVNMHERKNIETSFNRYVNQIHHYLDERFGIEAPNKADLILNNI